MPAPPVTIGHTLKTARETAYLTQTELARAITDATGTKWRFQSVSDAECDRPHYPLTYAVLKAWLEACRHGPADEETLAEWCALAGGLHPTIAARLSDPRFARSVYRQATQP